MDNELIPRRRYFIDKKFQFKYAGRILLFIVIAFCIFSLIFFQFAFVPLIEKLRNVYPQTRLLMLIKDSYQYLLISFFLLVLMAFGFSIFLSHRLAGSVFSLRRFVQRMSAGDFTQAIKLRKKDELKVLAEELSVLNRNVSFFIEETNSFTQRMQLALDDLHKQIGKNPRVYASFAQTLSEFETEVEELRESLKQYKI